MYNLTTKIVSVSKDVVFHERFFPYQYNKDKMPTETLKQIFLPIDSDRKQTTPIQTILDPNTFTYSDLDYLPCDTTIRNEFAINENQNINTEPTAYNLDPSYTDSNNSDIHNHPRRTTRMSKTPTNLNDFYCNTSDHWCGFVTHFANNNMQNHIHSEPESYKQAVSIPYGKLQWTKSFKP